MTKPQLCLAWVVVLVVAHLTLRLLHPDLGPQPGDAMFAVFIGLNLPTMVLGSGAVGKTQPAQRGFLSPVFLGGMALIMLGFMSAGTSLGKNAGLGGLLTVMTVQSLWLAWPVYWMARLNAEQGDQPGVVRKD